MNLRPTSRGAWPRTLAATAVLSLSLAGCGGSASSPSEAKASTQSSPSPQQNIAADTAAAKAAVLKLTDLPAGWTAKTDDKSDPDSDAADKQIAKCFGITVDELNEENPTKIESPDFEDADDHTISSTVEYEASVAKLKDDFNKASDAKVPGCLQKALTLFFDEKIKHPKSEDDKLPEGVKVGTPKVGQMSFPTIGDQTLAYRITVPIQAQGLSVTVYVDFVVASKGRASVEMSFESVFKPVDPATEQKYTKLVVDRLTRTTDADASSAA